MNRVGFFASFTLALLALASSMLFVVDQRQFGVIYALGQIKEVITEPGLNFKLPPPFQNVSYIDKRLLTLDSTDTEPMLTAEKQRVVIDWYVRWRISEPSEYIRNVGLDENAGAMQLNRVVRNALLEALHLIATDTSTRRVLEIAIHKMEMTNELVSVQERCLQIYRKGVAYNQLALTSASSANQQPLAIPLHTAAIGLQALVEGLVHHWLLDPQSFDLEKTGQQTMDVYLAGLTLPSP